MAGPAGPGRIGSNRHSIEPDLLARRLLLLCVGITAWLIYSHPATAGIHNLLVSGSANRSNPAPLSGQTFTGNIYVYTSPDTGVAQVSFYLDDPKMSGSPHRVERYAPYDFAASASAASGASALPLNTTQLASGTHTITALIALSGGGSQVVQGTFTVGRATSSGTSSSYNLALSTSPNRSSPASLSGQTVSDNIYVYTSPNAGVAQVSFYLDNPKMSGSPHRVERYAPYDFAGTASGATALPLNTTQLASGSHTITALIALSGGGSQVVQGTFTVTKRAATSGTGSATLSWVAPSSRTDGTPISLSELAGFRIYHGTDAKQLSLLVNSKDPTATTHTVSNLPAGTHYFAITTRDVYGFESARSKLLSKTIR